MASRHEPFHRKAFSKYGSSMGRGGSPPSAFAGATKARCRRVPLNSGGYDKGGAYWGTPSNLWCVSAEDATGEEVIEAYVRAPNREAAKAKFPNSVKWTR